MKRKNTRRKNLKLSILLLFVPFVVGILVIGFTFTDAYRRSLGALGMDRLVTENWEAADKVLQSVEPAYGRKFAYYELKERENLQSVSRHFSVPVEKLASMNPGTPIAGTTVRVTPVEAPLSPVTTTNGRIRNAQIIVEKGTIRVKNDFKFDQAITNLPELMNLLKPYGAIEQTGPKRFRLNKSVSIEENIRIDFTSETVEVLELRSEPRNAICLCFENAEALIKDTKVTSYEPTAKGPDTKNEDERSFIRAYSSSRLDVINSEISYLGNGLDVSSNPIQNEGGTYGISWRIPKGGLGSEIATGWVEGNKFYKNHFGSYTFGASGMVWKGNHYLENDVYGLDPHDDSNNALVEDNVFERNGKHGFIVSKRCNYNVIRNNVSFGNKLHGYMLHQDSVYNVMENNVAYDNTDNFAIFDADFNMVRNNRSFNARNSHVRVNAGSINTFIKDNELYGGNRGVYAYRDTQNVYVSGNKIQDVKEVIRTAGAKNIVFVHNTITAPYFNFAPGDRVIFGTNAVARLTTQLPAGVTEIRNIRSESKDE